MHAYLPPVEALAVQQHLEKAAQTGPVEDHDERSHDERMCDALTGAVLGTAPGDPSTPSSPKVLVNVFTPLNTLLGLRTALPAGTAPIDAEGHVPAERGNEPTRPETRPAAKARPARTSRTPSSGDTRPPTQRRRRLAGPGTDAGVRRGGRRARR